jgi:dipeptide transport system permease protein
MAQSTAAATRRTIARPLFRARLSEFWYYFSENKGAVAGLFFCIVSCFCRSVCTA